MGVCGASPGDTLQASDRVEDTPRSLWYVNQAGLIELTRGNFLNSPPPQGAESPLFLLWWG